MGEYSSEEAKHAAEIMERLLHGQAEGLELESDVAISDVESDVNAFSDDLSLLEDFNANAPALSIAGEAVPVSLFFAIGQSGRSALISPAYRPPHPWRRHTLLAKDRYEYLKPILSDERGLDGFESISRDKARKTFVQRAVDFVATRISAVRGFRNRDTRQTWPGASLFNFQQLLGGQQIATPGCDFTVRSNSNGLRVFWSGAYYVDPNWFGHPTSPRTKVLESGTYIFGVDSGVYGNNIQWDRKAVVCLPGSPPYVHLNY
jgi:hypothetical protein